MLGNYHPTVRLHLHIHREFLHRDKVATIRRGGNLVPAPFLYAITQRKNTQKRRYNADEQDKNPAPCVLKFFCFHHCTTY